MICIHELFRGFWIHVARFDCVIVPNLAMGAPRGCEAKDRRTVPDSRDGPRWVWSPFVSVRPVAKAWTGHRSYLVVLPHRMTCHQSRVSDTNRTEAACFLAYFAEKKCNPKPGPRY